MKTTFLSLVFAAGALAQSPSFMINTPTNAVVCEPLLLSWIGGTPPFFLSVLPGNQPSAPALVNLGQQNGNSFTWTVNQAAGTSLGLNLRDSNGQVAQSAPFTVNAGGDASCVGKNPSGSAGSGSPPATTGGATTNPGTVAGTTTPAGTSPASSPGGTSPATTRPTATTTSRSTTASGAAASTSNAASANMVQVGAAGIVGAALAALLA